MLVFYGQDGVLVGTLFDILAFYLVASTCSVKWYSSDTDFVSMRKRTKAFINGSFNYMYVKRDTNVSDREYKRQ